MLLVLNRWRSLSSIKKEQELPKKKQNNYKSILQNMWEIHPFGGWFFRTIASRSGWFMRWGMYYICYVLYYDSESHMVANILLTIIAILVIAILVGSIYALFASIFYFIFSTKENWFRDKGMHTIRYMILWLILTAIVLFLIPYIFVLLGLPGAELFNATNVLMRVRQILSYLMNFGGLRSNYVNDTTFIDGGTIDGAGNQYYGDYQL